MSSKSKSFFKKLLSSVLSAACLLSGTAVMSTAIGTAVTDANITAEAATTSSDAPVFSWDNATVYFLLTDRFCNGDPSNDHSYGRGQKNGQNVSYETIGAFQGGDFAGVTKKLNEGYFNDLGVNAIWISAPYEQIHGYCVAGDGDSFAHYSYHGYYVLDYTESDKNFGTKEEFKTMVDTAHEHGIRIVMDIVMNHTGYNTLQDMSEYGFGELKSGWDDYYYSHQNVNNETYHGFVNYDSDASVWAKWWGPNWIRCGLPGYTQGQGEVEGSLAGLPDFKTGDTATTELPQVLVTKWGKEGTLSAKQDKYNKDGKKDTVSGYISTWLAEWVSEFGVDGFRCDTAKHVEISAWKLLKDKCVAALEQWRKNNPNAPGANWTDKFWMTGEHFGHKVGKSQYFTSGAFDSMINFEFAPAAGSSAIPSAGAVDEIYNRYAGQINTDPELNALTYLASHDTTLINGDRIFAGSFLLMCPGGVQIYYGDESGRPYENNPKAMKDLGAGHQTRIFMNWDSMDKSVLSHWQKVGQFRNNHLAVGAGANTTISSYSASTGLTFARTYQKGDIDDKVVVTLFASPNTDITIDVSGVFGEGSEITNFYDGTTCKVSGGKVTFNSGANGTILCQEPSGKKGRVVVTHINKDTGATIKTETLSGLIGDSYTASPLSMEGFTVAKTEGSKTGKFSETEASVTFYYTFDTSSYAYVTVKYVDAASGSEIADSDTTTAKIGSTYNVSPKDVKDYEVDLTKSDSSSGTVKSGTNTVTFKYNYVEPTGLKVHYYNANGWASVYMYAYLGDGATATQLLGKWPGKQMTAESDGWFVCEVPDQESAKVLFTAGANGPQEPAQEQPGYELSGEVWMKNGKAQTVSKVKVMYVTTDGTTLGTATLSGMSGETYKTEAKTFANYELTSTPANATGTFGSSTTTVTYTYKSTSPDPLSNTSTVSTKSIALGSSVKVTCSSTGGSGTVQYAVYYKKASASSWTTAKDYSTSTTATVTPKYAEVYTIRIKAKDSKGTIDSVDYSVSVSSTFTNTSKVSATSINKGSSVKVTCASTGGSGTVKYAVYYKKASASSWTTAQSYSTTKTVTITPKYAEVYTIRVKAKNGDGTIKSKDLKVTVKAPLTNTSKLSATSVTLGSAAKVTFSSTGGTGTKKYAVWYKQASASSWTQAQDYKSNSYVTFTPKHTGKYDVSVKVKDGAGTIVKKALTLTVNAALKNTSTISATKITFGKSVKVSFASTGGTGTKKYAVWYKRSTVSDWTQAQDYKTYSEKSSVSFTPKHTGKYDVSVKVKDSAGTIVKKAFTVTVSSAALVNTSTLSTNAILKGKSFTVNCSSTGGTGTKKYAVWYKKTDSTSWTSVQSYSTNTSVSVTLKSVGTYDVSIKVKDGNDKISAQYYTVAVNSSSSSFKNTSTISATSVSAGTKITIKGASTDANDMAMYKYEYKSEGASSYTTIKDYTTATSAYFTPKSAGRYFVRVIAQDMTPTTKVKCFTVTVK